MDALGSPSSRLSPMTIDGSDQDLALANSQFLSREELIRRRLRRVQQLRRCYRSHYWVLMEELKSKYRDYYWTYGKSPFKEDQKNNEAKYTEGTSLPGENVHGGNGNGIIRCAFSGCKSKAMALTRYCHNHILSDSKQKLYRGCTAVAKNLPTGPSICNKPVLRSMVPPACSVHYQLGERCLTRAIRRAGYNIPANRKPNVKFHVVISEFIREIQHRRKGALTATVPKTETN
ncbi:hypothetical protein L6164_009147 [Bauhinia variegata]|uniref:Uncharacterized protein n=1 Tax=Bauhinia variegata TaxID=167791 RepID=A0ACB9PK48_BAUVA|nr:hypothetical protein L6164_009147 [Bauhinia variegata]